MLQIVADIVHDGCHLAFVQTIREARHGAFSVTHLCDHLLTGVFLVGDAVSDRRADCPRAVSGMAVHALRHIQSFGLLGGEFGDGVWQGGLVLSARGKSEHAQC